MLDDLAGSPLSQRLLFLGHRRFVMLGRLLIVLILTAGFAETSSAQSNTHACREAKVAFYVEDLLGSKDGVTRLNRAEEIALDGGCCPKETPEEAKASYERRRRLIVDPILNELRSTINQLAEFNGFKLFEVIKLEQASAMLAVDRRLDLTSVLTRSLNTVSPKSALSQQIEVPSLRFAVIDSRAFLRSHNGLRGFESVKSQNLGDLCTDNAKCQQLRDSLNRFALDRNLGAIFDSSREVPPDIRKIACVDATEEFISYFNRNALAN